MGTIDLNLFVAFRAVAERGGFSAAALALALPKSSVSRAIGALERQLGVQLFNRTTRRVALTSAGASLYARIAPQLEALEQASSEMPERDDQPSGVLRVTSLGDLGSEVLGEVSARLTAKHRRLEVELLLTDRIVDLVGERVDAALRLSARPMGDSSLVARRVGRVRMALYASPAYLERRGTPHKPDQLAAHDWATIGSSLTLLDVPVHARVRCNDGGSLRAVLRDGGGLGILPSYLAEHDVESGALVRVLPKWELRTGDLWLVYPSTRRPPKKLVAFREELLAAIARRPLLSL